MVALIHLHLSFGLPEMNLSPLHVVTDPKQTQELNRQKFLYVYST